METNTSLFSVMIVVGLAFIVPIVLHRLKLKLIPVVVAEITVGLLIGKSGLNWVSEDMWLNMLSMLGFIYLMFLSGAEIDFTAFRKRNKQNSDGGSPMLLSALMFAGIMVVSFVLALVLKSLGWVQETFLMALIISTISLGVVVPVLKEKKLLRTGFGQTLFLTTVISDLLTMILLALYISLLSENVINIWLLVLFFILVFGVYRLIKRFLNESVIQFFKTGTAQIATRAIFALILFLVVLSESLGVENILGAFLAGVIVSLVTSDKTLIHQLETFGYGFLIPIFFVMVGVKLDLIELLADPRVLVLIPVLLLFFFIAKLLPALLLKTRYTWKQVVGAGVILSSKLSLVIAAATVALDLQLIDQHLHGALILAAVLSCLVFPIVFNRLIPNPQRKKTRVSIIGANHITLPLSLDLLQDGFDVALYSAEAGQTMDRRADQSRFPLVELPELQEALLDEKGAFPSDVLLIHTQDDQLNERMAHYARHQGTANIVVRIEDPERYDQLQNQGYTVFSTLYAARTLLKALIENPGAVRLISQNDDSLAEVAVINPMYDGMVLKDLPMLGDILIMRIYRGSSSVIPHGNTIIKLGDRLLISGTFEQIETFKNEIE